MEKSKREYKISIMGCDDDTIILHELSDEEFAFMKVIADKVNEASGSLCMPTIGIEENMSDKMDENA